MRVDGGAFEELTGPLLLDVGDHTIVVRDAAGDESSPVEITVPPTAPDHGPPDEVDDAAGTLAGVVHRRRRHAALRSPTRGRRRPRPTPALPCRSTEILTVVDQGRRGVHRRGQVRVRASTRATCPAKAGPFGRATGSGCRRRDRTSRSTSTGPRSRASSIIDPDGNRDRPDAPTSPIGCASDPIRPGPISDRPTSPDLCSAGSTRSTNWWPGAVGSDQWFRASSTRPQQATETTGTLFVDRLSASTSLSSSTSRSSKAERQCQFQLSYSSRRHRSRRSAHWHQVWIPPFNASTSNKCRPDEPRCSGARAPT